MTDEEKLEKAMSLLSDMVSQADEDTPGEYRTRHFRDTMDDCVDFLVKLGYWSESNDGTN